jgi:branched-chain amino acid transport system ATP-binding protein
MRLELHDVTKSFGGVRAIAGVTMDVAECTILGVIGPNGAGKTTLFNLVTGIYRPDRGTIRFGDADLARLAPARIAAAGVARTFQNVRLFGQLSVLENLLVAGESERRAEIVSALLRLPANARAERALRARATELLDGFGLADVAAAPATSLPYGSQRRLEIARALMLRPRLLLLDEPAAGMNDAEADVLAGQIRRLPGAFDLAVVLVEHNMRVVMSACDEVLVLDRGETVTRGRPAEVSADPRVVEAYLGPAPAEGAGA